MPVGRADHRHGETLGQCGQLRPRLGQGDAVADEDHRALRGEQPIRRARHIGFAGAAAARVEAVPGWLLGYLAALHEQVVGHVEVDRARPAAGHGGCRLTHGEGEHLHPCRLEGALHHRLDDVVEVGRMMTVQLLERPAVELRGGHVGGDGEHRRGVGLRHGQRHDQVGRAGAGGGEGGGRPVRDAEEAIGHMRGGLLVARRDQPDPVAPLVERVEQADVAVSADAEHVGNLLVDQEVGDDVAALAHCHGSSLLPGAAGIRPLGDSRLINQCCFPRAASQHDEISLCRGPRVVWPVLHVPGRLSVASDVRSMGLTLIADCHIVKSIATM